MTDRVLRVGAVAMLLLTAAATRTGGWAVITVSDLPESLTAGTPVRMEYVVRQHGAEAQLLPGLTGSVMASSAGRTVTGSVTGGSNGRYVATIHPASTRLLDDLDPERIRGEREHARSDHGGGRWCIAASISATGGAWPTSLCGQGVRDHVISIATSPARG